MAMAMEEAEGLERKDEDARQEIDEVAASGAAPEKAPATELRTDFSETAFWQPHLLLDDNGIPGLDNVLAALDAMETPPCSHDECPAADRR